jgi:hypothetical protein
LKEAPETFAYLLMRQKLAAFEGGFAAFHSLDEPVLLSKVARDYILHDFARFAAVLVGALAKPSLQIGSELDFHPYHDTLKRSPEATRTVVPAGPSVRARTKVGNANAPRKRLLSVKRTLPPSI